ncbi:EndoU domain-containing protein [Kitasatospora sp. NE20-6]|uniref:EndoU domain-containing protein n=1 Tax=Kitasatospora sp. NE20-6 TaxID=2859066 RepID=UPI0038B2A552
MSADLGSDLIEALQDRVPALLGGTVFPVSTDRGAPAPAELVRWMPKKKSKSGPASQATTQVASSAGAPAPALAAATSAVSGEHIWVSFGDPERFRQHILSLELRMGTDPFSGLEVSRLVGGHQLDADGTIPVRDNGVVVRVTVPEGSRTEPLANGVFDATVEYRPLIGVPVTKLTTFYPAHLTWAQMKRSAAAAYRNAVLAGETNLSGGFHTASPGMDPLLGKFIGTDIHGNWLAGFVFAGEIQTAFPLNREPSTPRTGNPNPWMKPTLPTAIMPTAPDSLTVPVTVVPVVAGQPITEEQAAVGQPIAVDSPVAGIEQDLADLSAVAPPAGKLKAERIQTWVDTLWDAGRRARAAGALSAMSLADQVYAALERAKRTPGGHRDSMVAQARTLVAVTAAEFLIAAGPDEPVAIAEVEGVLTLMREAVDAQLLLPDGRFHGRTGEVLRALAALQELGEDRTGEEAWPAWISQWLAVLHSTVLVEGQAESVPRSVYDQHLQTLATHGVLLQSHGRLSEDMLKVYLDRLVLKPRHEAEQRLWLSDIQYSIGSYTGVEAADQRLEYLATEQKRIEDGQGKNPAQRRASGADDRYTTWAEKIWERIGEFRYEMDQLADIAPAAAPEQKRLQFAARVLQIGVAAWSARERGAMTYLQSRDFVGQVRSLVGLFDPARAERVRPYAEGALRAIRTVGAILQEPDRQQDDASEGAWVQLTDALDAVEAQLATMNRGAQFQHAFFTTQLTENARLLKRLRSRLGEEDAEAAFFESVQARKDSTDPAWLRGVGYALEIASIESVKDDGEWMFAFGRPEGLTAKDLSRRLSTLMGRTGRDRLALGVTSPHRMMLLFAQLERLGHLTDNPRGFVLGLRTKAAQLVRAVQAHLLSGSTRRMFVLNATSDSPYAAVTARLETVAGAWVQLVRFGLADESSVREEVTRGKVFAKLAESFGLPALGDQVSLLFDVHLRVVRGPARPADGRKWRTALLTELEGLVRGRKEKQKVVVAAYTQDSPVRYAGIVLSALVEQAAAQTAEPGQDFRERTRAIRSHLQKQTTDTLYQVVEPPVLAPARPAPVPDLLSVQEHADVDRALQDLQAMIPMVLSGHLDQRSLITASVHASRLVARQSHAGLVLRALVLTLAVNPEHIDPALSKRLFESLLAHADPGHPYSLVSGTDVDTFITDEASTFSEAGPGEILEVDRVAWLSVLALAVNDRQWLRDGYGQMTAAQLAALLAEDGRSPEAAAVRTAVRERAGKVIEHGINAVSGGYLTAGQFEQRLDQLPADSELMMEEDRPVLLGTAQLAAMDFLSKDLGRLPMSEEDFVDQLDAMARLTAQLPPSADEGANALVRDYRKGLQRQLLHLAVSSENGGFGLLSRYAAVVALAEELRYRGALLAEDVVAAGVAFGRWLGALEHAGLEAFGVAPGVVRSAFVRLLSVEVPEGFGERVGVLAARLASSDGAGAGAVVALGAGEIASLRERLRGEDVRSRSRLPREGGGQEIADRVVDVVARLATRITAVAEQNLVDEDRDDLGSRVDRWLAELVSFETALRILESDARVDSLATPSGLFMPAKGVAGFEDDGRVQLQAAFSFPRIGHAAVLHVHTDGSGLFIVGDRTLEPTEFYREVIEPGGLGAGQLLVFVGCNVDTPIAGGPSAAEIIRRLAPKLHLVSADGPVFTAPDGRVVTGRYELDADGRPKAGSWQSARFVLRPAHGGAGVDLGFDLLAALEEKVPALLGGDFPVSAERGAEAPNGLVRWMPRRRSQPGSSSSASAQQASPSGASGPAPVQAAAASAVSDEDVWVSFGDPERFKRHVLSLELRTGTDPVSGLPTARLVGGHQLDADGMIQVRDGNSLVHVEVAVDSADEPLPNGVFEAVVEYQPLVGGSVTKLTTFYPTHLSWQQMKKSVAAAYRNAVRSGEVNLSGSLGTARAGMDSLLGKFLGTDIYGNWLAGFVVAGDIRTAFPVRREQAAPRTDRPNPWVVGGEATVEQILASRAPEASATRPSAAERANPVLLPEAAAQTSTAEQPAAVAQAGAATEVDTAERDLAELKAAVVPTGKPTAEKVRAWIETLWGTGLRALRAGALTFDELGREVDVALQRAQRAPVAERNSLVASVKALGAVLAAAKLVAPVAGRTADLAEVGSVLQALRQTVAARTRLDQLFEGHAGEVLRALASVEEMSADWAGGQPWPSTFSQWLAVLHSGIMVARQQGTVPRSVYDQHLQVLATSGVALLNSGELTAADLQAELGRLVPRPRPETEQRMWLSDVRYAIGFKDAATAVGAATDRAKYLSTEQTRLDDNQGKNPAQRRAGGADERYTTWAQEIGERIESFQDDMERLDTLFPSLRAEKDRLLSAGHALQIRRQLWFAREIGHLPYAGAMAFMKRWMAMLEIFARDQRIFDEYSSDGFAAVRAVSALLRSSSAADGEASLHQWSLLWRELVSAESTMLLSENGPQRDHASHITRIRAHSLALDAVRLDLDDAAVRAFTTKTAQEVALLQLAAVDMPKAEVARASATAAEGDIAWALAIGKPAGASAVDLESRAAKLTGKAGRERVVTGVTSPRWMMLLVAHVDVLRHLAAEPEKFAADLRRRARGLVRAAQLELSSASMRKIELANATSRTPRAALAARLETIAGLWAELVRFGYADEASVRKEMQADLALEKLAQSHKLPEMGLQAAKLLDVHLRIAGAAQQPAAAKKWRDKIVAELEAMVRGQKGKGEFLVQPYTEDSPVGYAGTVLDALVERTADHVPAPGPEFTAAVARVRSALQKLTGEVSLSPEFPPIAPALPPVPQVVLSEEDRTELEGRLGELAATVPLLLQGAVSGSDFAVASYEVSELVARQSDPVLTVRATSLAMLGRPEFDGVLVRRLLKAVLQLGDPGAPRRAVVAIDIDALLSDLEERIDRARRGEGADHSDLDRLKRAVQMARSDRWWRQVGFDGTVAAGVVELLEIARTSAGQALPPLVSRRVSELMAHSLFGVLHGFLTADQFDARRQEVPFPSQGDLGPGIVSLLGTTVRNSFYARAEERGRTPMSAEELATSLDTMARYTALPPRTAALPPEEQEQQLELRRWMSHLRLFQEYGGVGLLPGLTAINVLEEELRYSGAVWWGDRAEQVARFDRWLRALEHSGLDTYRTAPAVLRSAFVRLLSVEVPEGFEERVGLLAARLGTPSPAEPLVPLGADARTALRDRLHLEDLWFRYPIAEPQAGQEVRSRVADVVARLSARRTGTAVPDTGVAGEQHLAAVRKAVDTWLRSDAQEPAHFNSPLEVLSEEALFNGLVMTPSGMFVPAKGAQGFADDGWTQLQAAYGFPRIGNAMVVHVHTDGRGRFIVGSRAMEPADFYRQVIKPNKPENGRLLVLVGCDVNTSAAGGRSAAQVIRRLAPGLHLVSADSPVFTTPAGRVIAGTYVFDADGRPIASDWRSGSFVLMPAGGGDPVPLGSDLLAALEEKVPAVLGGDHPVSPVRAVKPPAEFVRWMPRKRSGAATPTPSVSTSGSGAAQARTAAAHPTPQVREEDIWVSFGDPARFKRHIVAIERKAATDLFSGLPVSRLVGGHQLDATGSIRVWDGQSTTVVSPADDTRSLPLANGVFEAIVEYRPLIGQPLTKRSTFYPSHLTWPQMKKSAAAAYRHAVRAGEVNLSGGFLSTTTAGVDPLLGRFVGKDTFGNWLGGYTQAGEIQTAFPLYRQPAPADQPNPWYPSALSTATPTAADGDSTAAPTQKAKKTGTTFTPGAGTATSALSAQADRPTHSAAVPSAGTPTTADADLLARTVLNRPKAKAAEVRERVDALWGAGRRQLAAGALTFEDLLRAIDTASARARQLSQLQQGTTARSLDILHAVTIAEQIAADALAGREVGAGAAEAALGSLRDTIRTQLVVGEDFHGHAAEVSRTLAALQELSGDWENSTPLPEHFGHWLAVLHSSVMVNRTQGSIPRSVYDQHLEVLAARGAALVRSGQMSAADLQQMVSQLGLKARHEPAQRLWLSDIHYTIGTAVAATHLQAVGKRLADLAAEQTRLDEKQRQNPANRRGANADERYTAWARELAARTETIHQEIEDYVTEFPDEQEYQGKPLFDSYVLQIRQQLWRAKEIGYMTHREAMTLCTRQDELGYRFIDTPMLAGYVQAAVDTIRAVRALIRHPDDPAKNTTEALWTDLELRLDQIEVAFLSQQPGPQRAYAQVLTNQVFMANTLSGLRADHTEERATVLLDGIRAKQAELRAEQRGDRTRLKEAELNGAIDEASWSHVTSQPGGPSEQDIRERAADLTGDTARERLLTASVTPRRLMTLLAQVGQLRHQLPDPKSFATDIADRAVLLVKTVQAEIVSGGTQGDRVANDVSNSAHSALSARIDTIANAWVELVRFGFVTEAAAREELDASSVIERLAADHGMPGLGARSRRLLDLHLTIISGPSRSADARKWRSRLLGQLVAEVRGGTGAKGVTMAAYNAADPVRYAGLVLDALVEQAGRHDPAPEEDFHNTVRGLRSALKKLTPDLYFADPDREPDPARPPAALHRLSPEETDELSRQLDTLAALLPKVVNGTLPGADYSAVAAQIAHLVGRQGDPALTLQATVLAALGDQEISSGLNRKAVEALLHLTTGEALPEYVRGVHLVRLAQSIEQTASASAAGPVGQRTIAGTNLALNDLDWQALLAEDTAGEDESHGEARGSTGLGPAATRAVESRRNVVMVDGISAVRRGFLPVEMIWSRIEELASLPGSGVSPDAVSHVKAAAQIAALGHRLDTFGLTPMPDEEFAYHLTGLADYTALPATSSDGEPEEPYVGFYRTDLRRQLDRMQVIEERGGFGLLPRLAAITVLRAELRYRGALLGQDSGETNLAFDHWLRALEHTGLDAFRAAPWLMWPVFARMLTAAVPQEFDTRVGLLAAALAEPTASTDTLQPLGLTARSNLWRDLFDFARVSPAKPRPDGEQPLTDSVAELLARLLERVRETPVQLAGRESAARIESYRSKAEAWMGLKL